MPEKVPMTTRLKELFQRRELFVIVGGKTPLEAKMTELLGFEAFYMSGADTSAHLYGRTDYGTCIRALVDNARRIAMTVGIPVFADMETGFGDALSVHRAVKEYIRAGVAGVHLEDQEFPPRSGPRRQCIPVQEMVGKLKAAMDAKMEMDPDFVIVARCDYPGVPGATFEESVQRCLTYKREANPDAVCLNMASDNQSWEEQVEAMRRIPGPVLPLYFHGSQLHPTMEQLQQAGAAAAWYPGLTTMAGLQADWDFLNEFKDRGTLAIEEFLERTSRGKWGPASVGSILGSQRTGDRRA